MLPLPPPANRATLVSERWVILDMLRGFALIGILVVNIGYFALPMAEASRVSGLAEAPWLEQWLAGAVAVLFELKFVSLFSLLLGAGVALQWQRTPSGHGFAARHVRRHLGLAVIGLLHAYLIWYGDILLLYGLLGLLLPLVVAWSARWLTGIAVACLLLAAIGLTAAVGLQLLAEKLAGAELRQTRIKQLEQIESPDPPTGWPAILEAQFDPTSPLWIHAETVAFRDGPFSDALLMRISLHSLFLLSAAFTFGWHSLGLFLLGMAMIKLGLFEPSARRWHLLWVGLCLPAGLILELASASYAASHLYQVNLGSIALAPLRELAATLICLGYVGLFFVCSPAATGASAEHDVAADAASSTHPVKPSAGWLGSRLAAMGRLSLSNYLLQSLVMTSLMYSWGLGWFGSLGRPQMLIIVAAMTAAQLLLSHHWLRHHRMGPAEWLLRWWTYGRRPAWRSA
jgi:uncharacterized protein